MSRRTRPSIRTSRWAKRRASTPLFAACPPNARTPPWRRPGWPATEAPNLAILAGMAAYRALGKAGVPNLRVKWPNDILAGGRKICGVLVEPRIGAGRIEFAVVGIGMNVGQGPEDFPPELRDTATSCRIEGAAISVDGLLELLVESLREASQAPIAALRADWIAAGAREEEPEI